LFNFSIFNTMIILHYQRHFCCFDRFSATFYQDLQ
jgi:hypothetical protein